MMMGTMETRYHAPKRSEKTGHYGVNSPFYRQLVRAAEERPHLRDMFQELTNYLERFSNVRGYESLFEGNTDKVLDVPNNYMEVYDAFVQVKDFYIHEFKEVINQNDLKVFWLIVRRLGSLLYRSFPEMILDLAYKLLESGKLGQAQRLFACCTGLPVRLGLEEKADIILLLRQYGNQWEMSVQPMRKPRATSSKIDVAPLMVFCGIDAKFDTLFFEVVSDGTTTKTVLMNHQYKNLASSGSKKTLPLQLLPIAYLLPFLKLPKFVQQDSRWRDLEMQSRSRIPSVPIYEVCKHCEQKEVGPFAHFFEYLAKKFVPSCWNCYLHKKAFVGSIQTLLYLFVLPDKPIPPKFSDSDLTDPGFGQVSRSESENCDHQNDPNKWIQGPSTSTAEINKEDQEMDDNQKKFPKVKLEPMDYEEFPPEAEDVVREDDYGAQNVHAGQEQMMWLRKADEVTDEMRKSFKDSINNDELFLNEAEESVATTIEVTKQEKEERWAMIERDGFKNLKKEVLENLAAGVHRIMWGAVTKDHVTNQKRDLRRELCTKLMDLKDDISQIHLGYTAFVHSFEEEEFNKLDADIAGRHKDCNKKMEAIQKFIADTICKIETSLAEKHTACSVSWKKWMDKKMEADHRKNGVIYMKTEKGSEDDGSASTTTRLSKKSQRALQAAQPSSGSARVSPEKPEAHGGENGSSLEKYMDDILASPQDVSQKDLDDLEMSLKQISSQATSSAPVPQPAPAPVMMNPQQHHYQPPPPNHQIPHRPAQAYHHQQLPNYYPQYHNHPQQFAYYPPPYFYQQFPPNAQAYFNAHLPQHPPGPHRRFHPYPPNQHP